MPTVKQDDIDELSRQGLLCGVPREIVERLTEGSLVQRYAKGTILFEQGEGPDFLHVLLDGTVEMWGATDGGREAVIEVLTPVDAFILEAVLTDTPYLLQARVNAAARIMLVPAHRVRAEIAASPELAMSLLASLSGQFRRIVRQVKNLKLRPATQRVGCYLLGLGGESEGSAAVRLPYDKHLIASQLGMTRESLSRALSQLRALGVRTRGATVFLDDPAQLREYCRPDSLIDGTDAELRVRPN